MPHRHVAPRRTSALPLIVQFEVAQILDRCQWVYRAKAKRGLSADREPGRRIARPGAGVFAERYRGNDASGSGSQTSRARAGSSRCRMFVTGWPPYCGGPGMLAAISVVAHDWRELVGEMAARSGRLPVRGRAKRENSPRIAAWPLGSTIQGAHRPQANTVTSAAPPRYHELVWPG